MASFEQSAPIRNCIKCFFMGSKDIYFSEFNRKNCLILIFWHLAFHIGIHLFMLQMFSILVHTSVLYPVYKHLETLVNNFAKKNVMPVLVLEGNFFV